MARKVFPTASAALEGVLRDGMTVMCGGFGSAGTPEKLIAAIREHGARDLSIIANGCGVEGYGLWLLLESRQMTRLMASYLGDNKLAERLCLSGELQVDLTPQGTLAERIRGGGAGIPAFYTRTGAGTVVANDKEVRTFDGHPHLMERAVRADLAIIKAWKADPEGNLVYRLTARNFNPAMATAATVTIAEVEEVVELGELDPDQIHTPGIYVDRLVVGSDYRKLVEYRTTRPRETV